MMFTIDKTRCIRCGVCARNCPTGSIAYAVGEVPHTAIGGDARCMNCQHCLALCPRGAISVCGKIPADSRRIEAIPGADALSALTRQRRSCRRFFDENVPDEQINALLEAAAFAPSGCNYRGLYLSVIREKKAMDELRNTVNARMKTHFDAGKKYNSIFDAFEPAIQAGGDPIFRTAPHAVWVSVDAASPCAAVDPAIFLSYFELLAQTRNLGTCWWGLGVGIFDAIVPDLKPMLGIPEGYTLGYAMLFGIPSARFVRAVQRDAYPVYHCDSFTAK